MLYQIVPEFYQYDAISQHARNLERMMTDAGIPSRICAQRVYPESLRATVLHVDEVFPDLREDDVILLHFSIYTPLIEDLRSLPGRKIMIYHNITPAHFFEGISRKTAEACRKGTQQLKEVARTFHLALGVSRFNEVALREAGYENTGVLPLVVATNVDDGKTFRSLYYLSEKITLLHVGRWAPNKKIEDLVKVFYWYHKINPESRLILMGRNWEWENYTVGVLDLIKRFHLQEEIKIIPSLSPRDLAALYRASDIYLSMSEHEGFCVPLIEAMAALCPVVAYRAGAVPETVDQAGLLFEKKDYPAIAEGIHTVMTKKELQNRLKTEGKKRAEVFSYDAVSKQFQSLLPAILVKGRN